MNSNFIAGYSRICIRNEKLYDLIHTGNKSDKPFVLVVEDNRINQRVMSAFLTKEGVTFGI